jgi:hypothetical protein
MHGLCVLIDVVVVWIIGQMDKVWGAKGCRLWRPVHIDQCHQRDGQEVNFAAPGKQAAPKAIRQLNKSPNEFFLS